MMEMHTFQKARKTEILSQNGDKNVSARYLFVFLCEICEWVHLTPFIHYNRRSESDAVYVLFDHVAFAEDDFWQLFGTTMVVLHTRWQIDVFSTESSTQDTVRLSLEEYGDRFYGVQKNVSGRPANTMQAICLRIKCLSPEQAELLQATFKSTDWKKGIVVVDWMYRSFLEEENLISICHKESVIRISRSVSLAAS